MTDRVDAGPTCGAGVDVPVGLLVTRLGRSWSHGLRHALEPVDLDPRQYHLLRAVASMAGCSQQAVGSRLRIPPSRMVDLVDGLEARQLLVRVANPDDRRAHALVLTDGGRRLLAGATEIAGAYERTVLEPLRRPERDQLRALLARLDAAGPA